MSEELAVATVPNVENVFLTARNSQEMSKAQGDLADWLKAKIRHCESEATALRKAAEHAKKMKWQHKPLLTAFSGEMRRVIYYEKLLKAVQNGYVLVPFGWADVFAVRVKSDTPTNSTATGSKHQAAINNLPDVKGSNLAAGEGRYVSENPLGSAAAYTETKDGKTIMRWSAWSTDFQDVEFPVNAAKPELMSATAQAMALKIFDEIAVAPNRRGRDPVILGIVRGPNYRKQHFLIAWYLDTRAL